VRLLLDQGVPRRAAALLRDEGHDALHASEVGLSSAADLTILTWCRERDRVVVTLDADFHAELAVRGHSRPSVIRVRQEGLKGPEMAQLTLTVIDRYREVLTAGAMLTVRAGRVRVRALPVVRGRKNP